MCTMKYYDVSMLDPMPPHLQPLVMPTGNLCDIPRQLLPLIMPNKPNKPKRRVTVAMRTTLNINRMSWADMCESDVEDDDF